MNVDYKTSSINTGKKARIVSRYREGKGDYSCTKNINSKTLLDQHLEYLRNDISLCLTHHRLSSLYSFRNSLSKLGIYTYLPEVYSLLFWLRQNSFNISAFVLCKGETHRHSLDRTSIDHIEHLLDSLKKELGDCQDFVFFNDKRLILLDKVRIDVRSIELYLNECLSDIDTEDSRILRSLINRISSLLFWLLRKEGNKQEIYWKGYTTSLKF